MHLALASGKTGSAFAQEDLTRDDLAALAEEVSDELGRTLDRLQDSLAGLSDVNRGLAEAVLSRRQDLLDRIDAVRAQTPSGGRCRIHGDYHLGQVLVAQTDVVIIDFEGEPTRSLAERTAKTSPLRDVAGMLRSFDYALWSTVRRRIELGAEPEGHQGEVEGWREATQVKFLDAYRTVMQGSTLHPADPEAERALLDLFLIQKASYEVAYETAMRPNWIDIPLRGLLALIDEQGGES